MLRVILTIVQVFASLAIIGLVLLQRGKGAEAGAGFGAGASGTVFGARGASTALSRATAIFAAIFMINSLLLTYVGTRTVAAAPKTILDTIGEKSDKAKPGVTQTIPVPTAPSPGETAPPSTPADAGATGTTESAPTPTPTPASAPAAAPAPGSAAQAPAPAAAPAQPAPSTQPQGAPPK
jgi:preprotein translocase subunit SecG